MVDDMLEVGGHLLVHWPMPDRTFINETNIYIHHSMYNSGMLRVSISTQCISH